MFKWLQNLNSRVIERLVWALGIALLLTIILMVNHKRNGAQKELLLTKQSLQAEKDSIYVKVGCLRDSLTQVERARDEALLLVSRITIQPGSGGLSVLTDTIFVSPTDLEIPFHGDNYLFSYEGRVNYSFGTTTGSHTMMFYPHPFNLTSKLYRDENGLWFMRITSENEELHLLHTAYIDKDLILGNRPVMKPPKAPVWALYPILTIEKPFDQATRFNVGLEGKWHGIYAQITTRSAQVGVRLNKVWSL